jgi:hypothetical protein
MTSVWDDVRVRAALEAAHQVAAIGSGSKVDELLMAARELTRILGRLPSLDALSATVTDAIQQAVVAGKAAETVGDDALGQAARHLAATLEIRLTATGTTVGDLFLTGEAVLENPLERAASTIYGAVRSDGSPDWSGLDAAGRAPFLAAVRYSNQASPPAGPDSLMRDSQPGPRSSPG